MKNKYLALAALFSSITAFSVSAAPIVVDFENGYVDNELLNSGVELLDTNGGLSGVTLVTQVGDMSIEQTGENDLIDGFWNDVTGTKDSDDDAIFDLDGFYLRTTNALNGGLNINPVFSLLFSNNALNVSGEIWDIDGNGPSWSEAWEVTATFGNGSTQTLLSPVGLANDQTSLDGKAWMFSFASGSGVSSIDFAFTGSKPEQIGVAFDNLEFTPVNAPSMILMFSLGLIAIGIRSRSK